MSASDEPILVTKYPQSCMAFERGGRRLLVDVGSFVVDRYEVEDLGPMEAVLFTHRHADHFDERAVEALLRRGVPVYGNDDVCSLVGPDARPLRDGETAAIAGFEVRAVDLPHFPMIDGSAGPPNTGFLFDGRLLHPGDSLEVAGLRVDVVALPVAGPSVSFAGAYQMLKSIGARRAVAMHYDMYPAPLERFVRACDVAEVTVLEEGEQASV